MRSRWLIAVFAMVGVGTMTPEAWAWGPVIHVGLASSVMKNLGVLPAAVAAVLARHAFAYLYGNIAADIVFAKRWSRIKQFCHHWSTGFALLEASKDDRSRAFALGYLSHLAADTVAHGKFVPRQVVVSGCSLNFGHFYWELRADTTCPEEHWRCLEQVLGDDHDPHHRALEEHMTDTFLPYEFNRLLFDRMNALTVRESFRRTVGVWGRYSRWCLPLDLLEGYRAESLDRIHAILRDGARSALLREDPNGTSAMMRVRVRRREVRRLKRHGLPVNARMTEVSHGFAPSPRNLAAIFPPGKVQPPNHPAFHSKMERNVLAATVPTDPRRPP